MGIRRFALLLQFQDDSYYRFDSKPTELNNNDDLSWNMNDLRLNRSNMQMEGDSRRKVATFEPLREDVQQPQQPQPQQPQTQEQQQRQQLQEKHQRLHQQKTEERRKRREEKKLTEEKICGGFLRLHSTSSSDLKIYASDEGRVQMTAAAFTKGQERMNGRAGNACFRAAYFTLYHKSRKVLTFLSSCSGSYYFHYFFSHDKVTVNGLSVGQSGCY